MSSRAATALLAAGAALVVGGAAPVAAAPASAAGAAGAPAACSSAAHAVPARAADSAAAQRALLCLINRERARTGARPLRHDRCLARAATRHARDMVARGYFAHRSPEGRDFGDRIAATGYTRGTTRWTVGENLAWGTAPAGDPAWVLDAWLKSPGHRANLLRGTFRDAGVAALPGAPTRTRGDGGAPRATYAVTFGARTGGRVRCG